MFVLLITTSLIACGKNKEDESQKNDAVIVEETETETSEKSNEIELVDESEKETEAIDRSEKEDKWETKVGDSIENDGGTFTLIKRQDDIEQVTSGPVLLTIEQVNAITGELKAETAQLMETDTLEYLQVDVTVENSSEEEITFYVGQAIMTTNTGEQLEADIFLSDYIDSEITAKTSATGTYYYVLENSTAEEITAVRLNWSPPHDEKLHELGEKIEINVEF